MQQLEIKKKRKENTVCLLQHSKKRFLLNSQRRDFHACIPYLKALHAEGKSLWKVSPLLASMLAFSSARFGRGQDSSCFRRLSSNIFHSRYSSPEDICKFSSRVKIAQGTAQKLLPSEKTISSPRSAQRKLIANSHKISNLRSIHKEGWVTDAGSR